MIAPESLDVLLADHRPFHSTLQLRQFITQRSGRTIYGQYKQALRELDSRTWTSLDELLELADVEAQLDDEIPEDLSWKRQTIRDARLSIRREHLQRQVRDRLREWGEFYAQACFLRRQLRLAPDEQLDAESRDIYEREFWIADFAARAAARLEAGERPITGAEAELIATFPVQQQVRLLTAHTDPDTFLHWQRGVQALAPTPEPEDVPTIEEVRTALVARIDALGLPVPVTVPLLV